MEKETTESASIGGNTAQVFDEKSWKHDFGIQEKTAKQIAECLDIIFKAEDEMRTKLGIHWVKVKYHISRQEGSLIFFAEFEINRGLTKIQRTFLFDLWHSFSGFEEHDNYLRNEVSRFLNSLKYIS